MSVDYRLLPRFKASCREYELARRSIPERWRTDPRPEAQLVNELWVDATVRARRQIDRLTGPGA